MPVVFLCPNCQSRLKVTRRKIGTEIQCPRCQAGQVVPSEEAAAASVAMHQATRQPPPPDDPFPEFSVFDGPPPSGEALALPPVRGPAPAVAEDDLPPPRRSSSKKKPSQKPSKPPKHPATPEDRPANGRPGSSEEPTPPKRKKEGAAPPPPKPAASKPARKSDVTTVAGGIIKSPGTSSYSDLLLITRRTLYFQAILICIVGLAGLLGGFLIGRSLGPAADGGGEGPKTVEIVGTLTYRAGDGDSPDFGAVAYALPVDEPRRIALEPLGPHAPQAQGGAHKGIDPAKAAEAEIEDLGGAYSRTDGRGRFTLTLPQPGRYFLLFISKNARRPQGTPIDARHLEQLGTFTDDPASLIGTSKYVWVLWDVKDPKLAVTHRF